MTSLDLKQLSKIIDLCRKKGVESIEFEGIKVVLGSQPTTARRTRNKIDHSEPIVENPYSEEQTLLWSVGGIPMEGVG